MLRPKTSVAATLLAFFLPGLVGVAQDAEGRRRDEESRQARFLQRFPESDANKDGKLTAEEFRAFQAKRRANARNQTPRARQQRNRSRAKPTIPDVAYGEHPKQRFDMWPVPNANNPTPLIIYIHGGGFRGGDKGSVKSGSPARFHQAGVAFASMNYRLSDVGPYPIMMHDAARGLQTIRHRAKEWNIDLERIVCYGGSAGAGISLWLAFHDDLADPDSQNPIARQSTRILAAGCTNGQSTYDMHTFREWFGVPDLRSHEALRPLFGIRNDRELDKDSVRALMKDASPITHLSKDDRVAVYMTYNRPNVKVTRTTSPSVWVHHVLLGLKLKESMERLGLECHVRAPDTPAKDDPYRSLAEFLIAKAKRPNKK